MSLTSTHPIFSTCESSPYEVSKAIVQARFLSGRARVEALTRHWDQANKEGLCPLCRNVTPVVGTVEHLMLSGGCPALAEARILMLNFFNSFLVSRPYLFPIVRTCWNVEDNLTMQFLLDCSTIPLIIKTSQDSAYPILKDIFYMTRTFVFKMHTTRQRMLQSEDFLVS